MNYREFYFKNTNTLSRFINLIRISEIDYEIQKNKLSSVMHSHAFTELLFVNDGFGQFFLDGTCQPIKKGDVIIVSQGREHYEISIPNHGLQFFSIAFSHADGTAFSKNTIFSAVSDFNRISSTFSELLFECVKQAEYTNLICQNLSENLIIFLLDKLKSNAHIVYEEVLQKKSFLSFDQIKNYLDKNFNTKINVDKLARSACLSTGHFIRVFKKMTGKSPMQYILDLRLEAAIASLKYTDKPINAICYEIGFSDINNFIRKFKEKTNMTPQNFRNRS